MSCESLEVDSVEEFVVVMLPDGRWLKLTPRHAFDFVTELLKAIDGARSYGAAKRGEIPDPDPRRLKRQRGAR